jgi:hypothetical protein
MMDHGIRNRRTDPSTKSDVVHQPARKRTAIAKELEITEDRLIACSTITKTNRTVRREMAARL